MNQENNQLNQNSFNNQPNSLDLNQQPVMNPTMNNNLNNQTSIQQGANQINNVPNMKGMSDNLNQSINTQTQPNMMSQPVQSNPSLDLMNQQMNNNIYQQPSIQPEINQNIQSNNMNNELNNKTSFNNKKIFIIIGIVLALFAGVLIVINMNKDKINLTYDENGAFLFSIEDVFTITGKGTVVTGKVERGTVKVGDTVQIIGLDSEKITAEVTAIEMFRKNMDEATIGDNAGLYLKDITRDQVQRGQVLAKPNSIQASKKFVADVYVLTTEEEKYSTSFADGDKLEFYFRTTDIIGTVDLPNNIEIVNPGDNVSFTTMLETNVAMEIGTEFSIRQSGRTIATGTVTKIY